MGRHDATWGMVNFSSLSDSGGFGSIASLENVAIQQWKDGSFGITTAEGYFSGLITRGSKAEDAASMVARSPIR